MAGIDELSGQGWTQIAEFAIALVLSSAIGLEREIRQKAAGLRTYTVVGLGAALFTLVSKYGFGDVLRSGQIVLDPSRMAAQIVSGLGFIGAGVIFVQRGSVRGLTTAATVWLTAAIGSAAAAGLPLLAVVTTGAYFLVVSGLRPLTHRLPQLRARPATCRITYLQGSGLLRELIARITEQGFSVTELATVAAAGGRADLPGPPPEEAGEGTGDEGGIATVSVTVEGRSDLGALAERLSRVPGVLACSVGRPDE
ncbi:MgtC/SapB family protein [Kitasatospora sp. NPDC089797]|uniref:MgtC/SapB family protein n=1 Tax=Kitasatospora sp. NPDC089797 TaxID=3155298 RepID=UPI00341A346B